MRRRGVDETIHIFFHLFTSHQKSTQNFRFPVLPEDTAMASICKKEANAGRHPQSFLQQTGSSSTESHHLFLPLSRDGPAQSIIEARLHDG